MPAPGYFTDDSMLRRVHRENALALAGARALLMQAAHPVAFDGLLARSGAIDQPYERLHRTAQVMDTIAFGSREAADNATRRVRAIHRRLGVDQADLLLWVLATLADSGLAVYGRYVGSLSADEREAYWHDHRVMGRLFGLADDEMPADVAAFDDYMADMLSSGVLEVSPRARELAIDIVMRPPVPLALRPVVEAANFAIVGLLPPEVRRLYGFSWDPVRGLAAVGGAQYLKRVVVPLLPRRLRWGPSARRAA